MIPLEDLFELEKELKIKKSNRVKKQRKLELLRIKLGLHATDLTKEKIASMPIDPQHINDYADIIDLLDGIEYLDELIKILEDDLEEKYRIFKQYNDRDKQIYIEYRLKGYSVTKIAVRHGISRDQVYRTLKKFKRDDRVHKSTQISNYNENAQVKNK